MKILLIGQNGQIGQSLAIALRGFGSRIISFSRQKMNLVDLDQVQDMIRIVRPQLIVNSAAYTSVEQAEINSLLALRINGEAPKIMAQEAQRCGALFIHYSSDYVFDGYCSTPYDEQSAANPINVYGQTKFYAEQAIADSCEFYWIFRISWIYSAIGHNFLKQIIYLAKRKSHLFVTCDQFGAPTWSKRISMLTRQLLVSTRCISQQGINLKNIYKTTGIYHMSALGKTSWYEYAVFIIQQLQNMGVSLKVANSSMVIPIASVNKTILPRRPQNSCLCNEKLFSMFNIKMQPWPVDVVTCLSHMRDKCLL